MSHTPGPWELAMSADGCFILFGAKGRNLLTIPLDEQNEEKTANARLIAAAPELLKELREMLEYTRILRSFYLDDEDLRGKGTMIEEDIERVEALLKRVEKGGA